MGCSIIVTAYAGVLQAMATYLQQMACKDERATQQICGVD